MSRAPSEAQALATSPGASALTAAACSGCDSQASTSVIAAARRTTFGRRRRSVLIVPSRSKRSIRIPPGIKSPEYVAWTARRRALASPTRCWPRSPLPPITRTCANGRPMRRPTQILSPSKAFQRWPPSVGPMTRLLVTGGAGFIGSNFTRRAVGQGHDVVVLDKLTYAGNKENLRDLLDAQKIDFVKGDVCDRDLVDRLAKDADAVVHFAAETHVDRSILEAGDFVQTDVVGTFSVLEASRKAEVNRILHISTVDG